MAGRRRPEAAEAEQAEPPAKAYEPTTREAEAIEGHRARQRTRPPFPGMKFDKVNGFTVDHEHEATGCQLLTVASGFTYSASFSSTVQQLAQFCNRADDGLLEQRLNGILATVAGIAPRDDVEAMLAAQMAVTHELSLLMANRLAKAENIPQQDSAERAFNKLGRTFTAQIEALRRHRHGGQQKVTVEHVTVNQGGQAIVGNVEARGGGRER